MLRHRATKLESKHLSILEKNEKKCGASILHYPGPFNADVKKQIQNIKEYQLAYFAQLESYMKGKITIAQYKKRVSLINTELNTKWEQTRNEYKSPLIASFEARKRACSERMANQQQQFQHQDAMWAIQRQQQQQIEQQQEIQRFKQRTNDAEGEAWAAKADADRARQDADTARTETLIYQQRQ